MSVPVDWFVKILLCIIMIIGTLEYNTLRPHRIQKCRDVQCSVRIDNGDFSHTDNSKSFKIIFQFYLFIYFFFLLYYL
jgi:hypothetical protein